MSRVVRHRRCALAALLLSLTRTTWAAPSPELPFFEELPVVLSISRLPQALADLPGAVTVLDRETIRATGYRRIADLLRLVPGFAVAWERGWRPVVAYHGLADDLPNRLLVLVDGRPVNSEYFAGAADWISQALDVDDIERVEVLRGANSAAYGTNAFLGVVNISTRHASQARGVSIRVERGPDGIDDRTLRLGGGRENLDFRLRLAESRDYGLDRLADDSRIRFANLRVDLRPTAGDEITLDLGRQRGTGDEGFASDEFNPVRERSTTTGFARLRWQRTLAPDQELVVQLYRNRDHYRDEGILPLPAPFGPTLANQNRSSRRDSVELQHFLRFSPGLRAVWGAEWRRDDVDSEVFFGSRNPARSHTRRLFGNLEWRPMPSLLLNAGAMLEAVSLTGTDRAPRLFANWEAAPGHVLRAGYSAATRAPTLFEALADARFLAPGVPTDNVFVGNPALKRERIRARELGYFLNLPAQRLQADVRLYWEVLSDLVGNETVSPRPPDLLPFQTARRIINIASARLRGFEYRLKAAPFAGSELALTQAFERIAHADARVAASAPTHSTSLMWTQRLAPDLSLSIIQYWIGATTWLGFGSRVDAFRRTDARVGYAFRAEGAKGEISLVGLNLLDRYNEFKTEGAQGRDFEFSRRLFVRLDLEF